MHFNEVIGQQAVKDDLHQMVASDRLPHALLFLGPGGVVNWRWPLPWRNMYFVNNRFPVKPAGIVRNAQKWKD